MSTNMLAKELQEHFIKAFNGSVSNAVEYAFDVMSMSPYCPNGDEGSKDTSYMFKVLFDKLWAPIIEKGVKADGVFENGLEEFTERVGYSVTTSAVDHIFKSILWYGNTTRYTEDYLANLLDKTSFLTRLSIISAEYAEQVENQQN